MNIPINQIIQGNSLEVMKSIPDGSVDMVMADVPYGTTACQWDSIIPLEPMWEQLKRIIKPNGAIVMTASQPFTTTLIASNMKMFKYCWVWVKDNGTGFLNAKKQPLRNCEDIVVYYSKQCTYNPQMRKGKPYKQKSGATKSQNYGSQIDVHTACPTGERHPLTAIKFTRDKGKQHPTQKPVALMEYLIKTYTNEGEIVLDFTCGSGTTCVACVNTNRNYIGIELDEKYHGIAVKRVQEAKESMGLFTN